MSIDRNTFYKYQEHRATTGYGAALLVKDSDAETALYSMLIAGESVPAIYGSPETFEFDLLNSPVKGKVEGKITLESSDVTFLNHRDNIFRLNSLKGKVLDFLYVTPDYVGYKFSGTISQRPNEAGADVLRGTYTITPMSSDPNPIFNCRSMVQETLCFADSIPESIKSTDKINLSLVQSSVTATYSIKKVNNDGTTAEDSAASLVTTDVGAVSVTVGASGLYAITASATGYASWTTTIYIEEV